MESNYSWFLTDRSGKRYIFIHNTICIGRRACDINLKSNSVNLKHALLVIDESNDELKIKDLRSTNGTTVNNQPIVSESWIALQIGDVFKLADDYTLFKVNKEEKQIISAKIKEDADSDFPTSVSRPELEISSMKCDLNDSMIISINDEDEEDLVTESLERDEEPVKEQLTLNNERDYPFEQPNESSNQNQPELFNEISSQSKSVINKPNSLPFKPAESFVIGCDDFLISKNRNQSESDLLKTPTNPFIQNHTNDQSEFNIIETPRSDIIKPAEAFTIGCDNNSIINKKTQSASSIDNNSTNSRESFSCMVKNLGQLDNGDEDAEMNEGLDEMQALGQPMKTELQSMFPNKLKASFERREKMKRERVKEQTNSTTTTTHKLRSSLRSTKSDRTQVQPVVSPITKSQSLRANQTNRYHSTAATTNKSITQQSKNTPSNHTGTRNTKFIAPTKSKPVSAGTQPEDNIKRKPPPAKYGSQKPTANSTRTKPTPSTRLAASNFNHASPLVTRKQAPVSIADKRRLHQQQQQPKLTTPAAPIKTASHNKNDEKEDEEDEDSILPPSINVNKSFLMNKMFTGASQPLEHHVTTTSHPPHTPPPPPYHPPIQQSRDTDLLLEMATDLQQPSDLDEIIDDLREEEIVSQAGTYVLENAAGDDVDGRKSALSNQLNSSTSTFSGPRDVTKGSKCDDQNEEDTSTISSKHSRDELNMQMELESKSGAESDYDNDAANDDPKKWSAAGDEYSGNLASSNSHYDRVSMGQLNDGTNRYMSGSGPSHRVYDSGHSNFMAAPDLVMDNRMTYDDASVNSKSNQMTDHQYGFKSDLRNLSNQSDDPINQSIDIPLSSQLPSYHKQTQQSTKTNKRTNYSPSSATNSNNSRDNQTNYQSKLMTNQNTGTGKSYKKVQKKKPTATTTSTSSSNITRKSIGSEDLYVPDYEEEQRKSTTTTTTNRGVIMRRQQQQQQQQQGKSQQKSSHQKQMLRQTAPPPNTENESLERGHTNKQKQKQGAVTMATVDNFQEDRYGDMIQMSGNSGVPPATTRYPRSTFSVASLDTALLLQDTEALLNDMERRVYSRKDLRSFEEQQQSSSTTTTNSYSTNNPDKIPYVDEVGIEDDMEISSQVSSGGLVLNIAGSGNNNASTNTISETNNNNATSASRNNGGVRSPINNSSSYSNSSMIRRNNSCKVPIRGTTSSASTSISNSNAINNSITTNNLLDTSGSSNQNNSLLYRNQRSTSLIEDRSNQHNVPIATNTNNLATMSPIPPSMKELNYDHQQPHNYYHNYRNTSNNARQPGKQLSGVTMPTNPSAGYHGLRRGSASGVFYNMPPLTNNSSSSNNNNNSSNPVSSTTSNANKPLNIGMQYGPGGFMSCVPRQRMTRYEFGQHSLKHNSSSTTMLYQKQSSLSPQWSTDDGGGPPNPNLYSPGNRPINNLFQGPNDYYPYCTMPDSFDIGTLHSGGRLESEMLGASQPHLLNALDEDQSTDLYDYSVQKRLHPYDQSLDKSGPMGFHAGGAATGISAGHGNMSGRSSAFSLCQSSESINNTQYSSHHLSHHLNHHGYGHNFNFGAIPSKSRSSLGINEQKNNNYDVLLISSIHLFSARLCRYAEEIIHRLRREDLELLQTSSPLSTGPVINGPSSGDGPNNSNASNPGSSSNNTVAAAAYSSDTMGRTKIQNKELSECLSNMKNLERLLQKIDKSLFPIDSTGRKSTMGNCPENVYLTHLEKIHKEIKDFVPIKPTAIKPHSTKIDSVDAKSTTTSTTTTQINTSQIFTKKTPSHHKGDSNNNATTDNNAITDKTAPATNNTNTSDSVCKDDNNNMTNTTITTITNSSTNSTTNTNTSSVVGGIRSKSSKYLSNQSDRGGGGGGASNVTPSSTNSKRH